MDLIHDIQEKFEQDQVEFSKHAVDRMILRHIAVSEVFDAVRNGAIIEDYPDDKYGPSCLILGFTRHNRPLHIQSSYPRRPLIKVITVYEPDPDEWLNFTVRLS
jgi:hypothetical protein